MKSSTTDLATRSVGRSPGMLAWLDNVWAAAGFLFILSVLVRLVDLTSLPRWDELWTLFAARGWLEHGVPRIAGGVYDRAELYTIFVAGWLNLLGDSVVVARLPSVLFGSLLVVAVFVWTNAVAGRTAAWISGLFVALAAVSVEMSQYARFYALHALSFWLGAIGAYALATGQVVGSFRQVAVAAGAVLLLSLAFYLQLLTLIGIAALLAWLAAAILLPALARRCRSARQFWGLTAALVLVAGLAGAVFLATDFGAALLERYLETPLNVIHHEGEFWFYHLHLIERYPMLWPIFPFLALIAVAARSGPGLFAVGVFGVAFALVSFGGQKSWHYLFFALPFLFVVWAIALAHLWPFLRDVVRDAMERVLAPVPPRLHSLLGWALIAGSVAFLVFANGSPARTLLRPLGVHLEGGFSADWPRAVPQLEPLVRTADVVLTSHELHMLYYLGRADIVLSKARRAEFAETEFARDRRTGLPIVSRPESLELVMSCYPTGLLVTDTKRGWRTPNVIDGRTADFVVDHMTPIDLPAGSRLVAFQWQTPTEAARPAACAAIAGDDG